MAPSSDDNVKNVGSVHLTSLVVLSNPRSLGTGMATVLDLHLLLEPVEAEGEAVEKTVLARLYNQTKISFSSPRVCFVSIGVRPPPPCFILYLFDCFDRSPASERARNIR